MDQGPLVTEQIDAGAKFLGEFQKYAPVKVAFWLKESDVGEWNLYVASDRITDENFDDAYGEVFPIAGRIRDPFFDPFQVKVLGTDAPLARAALDVIRRFPGPAPARVRDNLFGGVWAEEVYVYPSPIPVLAA